tara:strand:+ start:132 stop:299 length:168 start_codon:yes stop_codon:yes gene_type:complete
MFLLDCIFIKSYYKKKHKINIKQNKKPIINNKYKSPEETFKKNKSYDKLLLIFIL